MPNFEHPLGESIYNDCVLNNKDNEELDFKDKFALLSKCIAEKLKTDSFVSEGNPGSFSGTIEEFNKTTFKSDACSVRVYALPPENTRVITKCGCGSGFKEFAEGEAMQACRSLSGNFQFHNKNFEFGALDSAERLEFLKASGVKPEKTFQEEMSECGNGKAEDAIQSFRNETDCIAEKFSKTNGFHLIGIGRIGKPTAIRKFINTNSGNPDNVKCSFYAFSLGPEHTRLMTTCSCPHPEYEKAGSSSSHEIGMNQYPRNSGCNALTGTFKIHNFALGHNQAIVAKSVGEAKPQEKEDEDKHLPSVRRRKHRKH